MYNWTLLHIFALQERFFHIFRTRPYGTSDCYVFLRPVRHLGRNPVLHASWTKDNNEGGSERADFTANSSTRGLLSELKCL